MFSCDAPYRPLCHKPPTATSSSSTGSSSAGSGSAAELAVQGVEPTQVQFNLRAPLP